MVEQVRQNIERIAQGAADAIFGRDTEATIETAILDATHRGVLGGANMVRDWANKCEASGITVFTPDMLRDFADQMETISTAAFAEVIGPASAPSEENT